MKPPSPPGELALRADDSEMGRASEWLETLCVQHGVPKEHVLQLLLCLDEALQNVIHHGAPEALAKPIGLRFETGGDASSRTASVTVSDAGPAFDPVSAPENALPQTLEEALPGGRGLQMMRASAAILRYRRAEGRNHLTFGTSWRGT